MACQFGNPADYWFVPIKTFLCIYIVLDNIRIIAGSVERLRNRLVDHSALCTRGIWSRTTVFSYLPMASI